MPIAETGSFEREGWILLEPTLFVAVPMKYGRPKAGRTVTMWSTGSRRKLSWPRLDQPS
jgi:hypothetical protein